MRKLFSIIAATLVAMTMSAKEVTISKSVHDLFPDDANGTQEATLYSDSYITISVNPDGNNGKIYGTGTEWRLYQANSPVVTIAGNTGVTIKTASFTYTVTNTGVLKFDGSELASGAVATVNASSATFSVGNTGTATNGQVRVSAFVVVYDDGDASSVSDPVFAPLDAWFENSVSVSLTCGTTGAKVYYTLDGTEPSTSATEYTAPFVLTSTTTVKAIAVKDAASSNVVEKTYKEIVQYEVNEAIAAGLAEDDVIKVRGVVSKMQVRGTNFKTYGSMTFFVADATGAEGEFEFFNCLSLEAAKFTSYQGYDETSSTQVYPDTVYGATDYIAVGDTVIAYGKFQLYNTTYELKQNCNIVDIKHPGVVPPVTYNITVNQPAEGGTIEASQVIAVEGETITLTATPDANYVFGAWDVKDGAGAAVTVTENAFVMPASDVTVSAVFQPVPPVGCDWDNLPFFNTGLPDTDENYNQFKICKEGEQPNVVNIQTAGWADNHKGIYASYPSAAFGAINIDAANYTIQGAGILFHLDAFTANETEVSVVCDNVEMVFTVLNTKAITPVVPIEITIDENVDLMDDLASTGGFWLLAAQNDDFTVVIGNANAVTELAGTYTVADLDAESYIKTATDSISFVDGSITVEELAGGIHFRGTIEGNDGEFYLLSISKALVGPTVVDVVAASPDDYVRWTDAVASQGWWQIYGEGAEFGFSLSNTDTDEPAGTYGIDDLDPDWCYVVDLSNTADTITFSDGEVVVAIDAEGVVTVTGELLGSDGKTYAFDLTYQDPTAETTVNVTIAEGELDDTYLESAGLFGLAGVDATNNITAQFYIWTEDGMAGDYTEEDLDFQYFGSGIMVGTTVQEIFSATLHVAVDDNNEVVLTADVLCYNNTLYKVTLTVPGETPQPTYAVTFAQPQNGTLVVKNEGVAIASGDEFEAGVVLTVEATPADGFVLSTLTAGGVDIIDAKRFTIVDAAVEVVATFVADPTGINNVEGNQRRIKAIENGQLFINVNGVRYNVNGARVK